MPTTTLGQRVERAHLAFTLAVHQALAGSGTACWSPYSVASALGLAATGARGTTRDELATLLVGSPDGDLAEHGAMLGEASSLTQPGAGAPPVLDVANTLWHDRKISILDEFLAELAGWPNPAVHDAPFLDDPVRARSLINSDVGRTTHGLIRELIGEDVIKRDTVAMLVNALYLKVAWTNKFPAHETAPLPFHAPTGQITARTMMLARKQLGYAAADGWRVVVLPAMGGVEAVVLLPDGDVVAAESTLDAARLASLLAAPRSTLLQLYLPKFRVRVKGDLDGALQSVGVRTMFSDDADFSGMSRIPLAVDRVVHEAVLRVDEEGLEGAAATAAVMRMLSMMHYSAEPIVVHVDRPFLFLVRHKASGAVYFLARVMRP
jgi:serpin B